MKRRLAFLLALAAATAVLLGPGPATAAPTTAVVASWKLPGGYYGLRVWRGAMWLVRTDDIDSALVERVDPATNTLTKVTELRFASGGFAVGDGSLWVSDWFGNAVWRLAPDGTVQARIPTGLQPGYVEIAYGSVWSSNHHDATVTRIDPATDGVVGTFAVGDPARFRDGPSTMTAVGSRLWVTSGDLDHPQAIDPGTNRVLELPRTRDLYCAGFIAVGGLAWGLDPCTNALFGHRADGSVEFEIDYPGTAAALSATTLQGSAWVGVDRQFDLDSYTGSHGVLEQRAPTTGALLRTVPVGGDVSGLIAGFGSLWVVDGTHPSLRRVDVGTSPRPVDGTPVR